MAIPNQTGIAVDVETKEMLKTLAGDRPVYLFVKELVQAEADRRQRAEQSSSRDILVQLRTYLEQQDKKISQYEKSQRRVEALYAKWDAIEKVLNSVNDAISIKALRKLFNDLMGNGPSDELSQAKEEIIRLRARLALLDKAEEQKRAFRLTVEQETEREVQT